MSRIPKRLRRLVVRRAANRCEYCRLSQIGQEATFHVDHIVPRCEEGPTTLDNLALACVTCSLRKERRRFAIDPVSKKRVRLFHPRRDDWHEHFEWNGVVIEGKTTIGRATIGALKLNRRVILAIRKEEAMRQRHPPPE